MSRRQIVSLLTQIGFQNTKDDAHIDGKDSKCKNVCGTCVDDDVERTRHADVGEYNLVDVVEEENLEQPWKPQIFKVFYGSQTGKTMKMAGDLYGELYDLKTPFNQLKDMTHYDPEVWVTLALKCSYMLFKGYHCCNFSAHGL